MSAPNFEGLLREALAPVEPPEDLAVRLERTLTTITELAAEELEAWELSAMRDPRNWARPAAALVVGGSGAATALVLLRARRRAHRRSRRASTAVRGDAPSARSRDLGREARKLLGDR